MSCPYLVTLGSPPRRGGLVRGRQPPLPQLTVHQRSRRGSRWAAPVGCVTGRAVGSRRSSLSTPLSLDLVSYPLCTSPPFVCRCQCPEPQPCQSPSHPSWPCLHRPQGLWGRTGVGNSAAVEVARGCRPPSIDLAVVSSNVKSCRLPLVPCAEVRPGYTGHVVWGCTVGGTVVSALTPECSPPHCPLTAKTDDLSSRRVVSAFLSSVAALS